MRKFNIGMTFYGGVSLAVYEAGVAEEFIRFVQFCKHEKGFKYLEGKISDVDVKIISGSSAGGLAAVLMSAALVNSSDPTRHIEEIRRIWFDVADLSTLQYKSGQDVCSLLNNDVLEVEVKNFLKIKEGEKGLCKDLKILVTGTNMQGFFDAVPIEDDFANKDKYADRAFPTMRHTEVFEFEGSEIRNASNDPAELNRIAKAARITSSFPAAFPPQLTQSPSFHKETFNSFLDDKGRPMEKPLHFWYFDGGVLDNKPLGHAIDHMESNCMDGNWWYFFIEPKQEDTEPKHLEWGLDPGSPPDPSATVRTVMDVRGAETIYHDLRRIQKINHQVMQINSLVSDIWNLIGYKCSDIPSDYLGTLEDNVRTARLHRFLPDYLKCVTMLNHSFVRTKRLAANDVEILNQKHGKIVNSIPPMELRKIISDCRSQIEEKKIHVGISEEEIRRLAKDIEALEYGEILEEYEEAVKRVKSAQMLFRQIAFWIEDDYKTQGELSEATWKEFNKAWDKLNMSVDFLNRAYGDVASSIKEILVDEALIKKIWVFVMLNESAHAASGVETRERINVVKIYHNEKLHGFLAGAKIANFAGFLERRWRKNDYLMGIKDAREMLKGRMDSTVFTKEFWDIYDNWLKGEEGKIHNQYQLSDNDIIKEGCELRLDSLSAGKVVPNIDGILKTSEKLISKYREKTFFCLLRKIKVNWMLWISRPVLWLVKQATAQPSCQDGAKDISTLAKLKSEGRRYLGFLCFGIIIGLLLSFFLPDMIREGSVWLFGQIRRLIAFLKSLGS